MKMLFTNPLLLTWLITFSAYTVYTLPKFIKKNTMEYKLLITTLVIFLASVIFLMINSFAHQLLIIPDSIINFLDSFASVSIFIFYCFIVMLPGTIAKFSDKKALQNLLINILFFVVLIILLVL